MTAYLPEGNLINTEENRNSLKNLQTLGDAMREEKIRGGGGGLRRKAQFNCGFGRN